MSDDDRKQLMALIESTTNTIACLNETRERLLYRFEVLDRKIQAEKTPALLRACKWKISRFCPPDHPLEGGIVVPLNEIIAIDDDIETKYGKAIAALKTEIGVGFGMRRKVGGASIFASETKVYLKFESFESMLDFITLHELEVDMSEAINIASRSSSAYTAARLKMEAESERIQRRKDS